MRRPRRAGLGLLSPWRAPNLGKIRRRACLRLIPFPGTGDVLLAPTMISHPLAYVAPTTRQEELVLGGTWRRHGDLDLSEKQLETKTEDICMVRWSKPSGEYIMNFYRPKYVSCKKTKSGGHTRCSRGRGRAQGVGRTLHPRGGLVSFPDCFLFFCFSKYSKTEKNCH